MCDSWRYNFAQFAHDMGQPPSGLMIERIDNDGNYEPGNCRWASPSEQAINQNRNAKITWRGESLRLTEWANKLNVRKSILRGRKHLGWSTERMLSQPPRKSPTKKKRHAGM